MTRRMSATVAAGAAIVALLTACGGGDDDDAQDVASLGTEATADEEPTGTESPVGTTAADGSTPTNGSTPGSAPTDPEEAMLAYTECMREHGIDMPDPQFDEEGRASMGVQVEPGQEDEMEAAEEACGPLLDNAMQDIEVDPEEQAQRQQEMLEYTECMREHGIDMPDPVFDDNGGVTMQMDEGATPIDPEDEEFQAAQEACAPEGDGGMIFESDEADS
jgi:hypothetical protein